MYAYRYIYHKMSVFFFSYGDVASVQCLPHKSCAFVNFKTKQSAENAMAALQVNLHHGQTAVNPCVLI